MERKGLKCRTIGNSQGFIVPKDEKGEPRVGKKYTLSLKEENEGGAASPYMLRRHPAVPEKEEEVGE